MVKIINGLTDIELDSIRMTMSDSGCCGFDLRKAHYVLGQSLGTMIANDHREQENFTILVVMRAGLCLGLGIAEALEKSLKRVKIEFNLSETSPLNGCVIIADAVINSGKTALQMAHMIHQDVIIATNVISRNAIDLFALYHVYASRISQKSYVGTHSTIVSNGVGPDTGDRLFDSGFYD